MPTRFSCLLMPIRGCDYPCRGKGVKQNRKRIATLLRCCNKDLDSTLGMVMQLTETQVYSAGGFCV
jgi:hypothetical protein